MTARQLAFSLLQKAEKNDQFLNLALDHALRDSSLSDADRALCATLVYGVTEKRLTLDHVICHLSSRPESVPELPVRTALRMGLYQLIYLDRIPPHAAINESVSLVSRKASGFVNAVLRAYTRKPSIPFPDPQGEPARYLSLTYSDRKSVV